MIILISTPFSVIPALPPDPCHQLSHEQTSGIFTWKVAQLAPLQAAPWTYFSQKNHHEYPDEDPSSTLTHPPFGVLLNQRLIKPHNILKSRHAGWFRRKENFFKFMTRGDFLHFCHEPVCTVSCLQPWGSEGQGRNFLLPISYGYWCATEAMEWTRKSFW